MQYIYEPSKYINFLADVMIKYLHYIYIYIYDGNKLDAFFLNYSSSHGTTSDQ